MKKTSDRGITTNNTMAGMTLIETLLVLSMIAMIVGIGYSFYSFGLKAFSSGENRSNVQYEIRKAAQFISSQTRFGVDIAILSEVPASLNPDEKDKQYLYVKDGFLMYYDGVQAVKIAGSGDDAHLNPLAFSIPRPGFLHFEIDGFGGTGSNQQNYRIKSEVKLLNLEDYDSTSTGPVLQLTSAPTNP